MVKYTRVKSHRMQLADIKKLCSDKVYEIAQKGKKCTDRIYHENTSLRVIRLTGEFQKFSYGIFFVRNTTFVNYELVKFSKSIHLQSIDKLKIEMIQYCSLQIYFYFIRYIIHVKRIYPNLNIFKCKNKD